MQRALAAMTILTACVSLSACTSMSSQAARGLEESAQPVVSASAPVVSASAPVTSEPTQASASQPEKRDRLLSAPLPLNPALPGLPSPVAPAVSPATPVDAAQAIALAAIIKEMAQSRAPRGAQPLGPIHAARFDTGQQFEVQVQMEPGKCYTMIGVGSPSTDEVDLKLIAVTPLGAMAPVLAIDNTTGRQAVLGAQPNCFKWAWPIAAPVNLVMRVPTGSGLAAMQLYGR